MSDQGDTGPWRPATSQSDQYSTPDETTGPLPAISGDEADAPGFPSVSGSSESWSAAADDDDAPTGGFPAVSPAEPQSPAGRSPFEPVERSERSFEFTPPPEPEPEPEDPGPEGTTPAFGTPVRGTRPAPGSFGSDSFDGPSAESSETSAPSSSESSLGSSYYGESSFGSGASSLGSGSFGESSFGTKPFGESSYGSRSFADTPGDTPEAYGPGTSSPRTGTPESDSSTTGSFTPPAPVKGVSAEDEAAENDFFASDDHPPMWDKVVAPAGPPPQPGKPSSGNLRLPDWMRDEGGAGGPTGGSSSMEHDDEGHSRRPLFVGVGILVAGLLAVGGVYVLKGDGDSRVSNAAAPTRSTAAPSQAATTPAQNKPKPQKPLPKFKGVHTKAVGRVTDARSGLSYPRFAKPWALPAKRSPMSELNFSTSQFAVTEKTGAQPKHWARLMSAELAGAAKDAYSGPGTEREAATEVAQMYEARMYGFRHKKRALASQPLNIGGHKGWLVSDYLTFRRPGVKATGDVVAVALVNTGRKAPGILFMSVPNTDKKLWPDINFVARSLRVS
jgi:hypothetical protein